MEVNVECISERNLWRINILIFVCTGSRNYQFDRLIKKLDELIEEKVIKDEVFAQIGDGTYIPKNMQYKKFVDADEYKQFQQNAEIVITHGGTGSIVGALKNKKNVIAVPRLAEYGEHIDNHQLQIVDEFEKEGYILSAKSMEELAEKISFFKQGNQMRRFESEGLMLGIIREYIDRNINKKGGRNE